MIFEKIWNDSNSRLPEEACGVSGTGFAVAVSGSSRGIPDQNGLCRRIPLYREI